MKRLLAFFFRRQVPASVRPLRPIVIDTRGGVQLSTETMRRLAHLQTLGYLYREQVEAATAECCQLFGVDADSGSIEADWCREIVLDGTDIADVVNRILDHRREVDSFLS